MPKFKFYAQYYPGNESLIMTVEVAEAWYLDLPTMCSMLKDSGEAPNIVVRRDYTEKVYSTGDA